MYNSFNSWGWLEHTDNKIKKEIRVITGDIRDEFLIKNQLKKCGCCYKSGSINWNTLSYRAPKSYFDTNAMNY